VVDMTGYFMAKSIGELNQLRSKTYLRLLRLQSEPQGYFTKRDMAHAMNRIKQIDAALAAKKAQLKLF